MDYLKKFGNRLEDEEYEKDLYPFGRCRYSGRRRFLQQGTGNNN